MFPGDQIRIKGVTSGAERLPPLPYPIVSQVTSLKLGPFIIPYLVWKIYQQPTNRLLSDFPNRLAEFRTEELFGLEETHRASYADSSSSSF